MKKLTDKFAPYQVGWRIISTKNGSVSVAFYVDSRAVSDRLDEVYPDGWSCAITSDQRKIDIEKYDKDLKKKVVTTSNVVYFNAAIKVGDRIIEDGSEEMGQLGDAMKGGASKAFIRAGAKMGIGRYLYDVQVTMKLIQGYNNELPPKNNVKFNEAWHHIETPRLPAWAVPDDFMEPATQEDFNELSKYRFHMTEERWERVCEDFKSGALPRYGAWVNIEHMMAAAEVRNVDYVEAAKKLKSPELSEPKKAIPKSKASPKEEQEPEDSPIEALDFNPDDLDFDPDELFD